MLLTTAGGARVLDCGVKTVGGIQTGLSLARVCLAGQAEVSLLTGDIAGVACPIVQVLSDNPVQACMASQYAGWQIAVGKFFAMGSGPMRALYGKEELYDHIPGREQASCRRRLSGKSQAARRCRDRISRDRIEACR